MKIELSSKELEYIIAGLNTHIMEYLLGQDESRKMEFEQLVEKLEKFKEEEL